MRLKQIVCIWFITLSIALLSISIDAAENQSLLATQTLGEIKALSSICRESIREIQILFNQIKEAPADQYLPLMTSVANEWSKIGYQAADLIEKVLPQLNGQLTAQDKKDINAIAQSTKQTARAIDEFRTAPHALTYASEGQAQMIEMPEEGETFALQAPEESKYTQSTEQTELPESSTSEEISAPESEHMTSENEPQPTVADIFPSHTQAEQTASQEAQKTTDDKQELHLKETEIFNNLANGAPTIEMVVARGPIGKQEEEIVKKELRTSMSDFEEKFSDTTFLSFITDLNTLYSFAKAYQDYHKLLETTSNDEALMQELNEKTLQVAHEFVQQVTHITALINSTQWYSLYKRQPGVAQPGEDWQK